MEWLDRKPGGGIYAFGSPDHTFLRGLTGTEAEQARLADLARVPPDAWTNDDVRGVIRQMQEASSVNEPDTPPAPKMEDDGDTIVSVRAYTRHGEKGPVHVSSHQRSSPD